MSTSSTPFLESPRFPERLAYSSSGGPSYSTSVVRTASGREYRNANWAEPLHTYNAAKPTMTRSEAEELLRFFHAVGGMHYAFRFKDPADYRSGSFLVEPTPLDQPIGTGDGSATAFQLVKQYVIGGRSRLRTIRKPVPGTVRIAVAGVEQSAGWSVDTATGVVTFTTPPAAGALITAGFEFDVPCRFDSDSFVTQFVDYDVIAADVPLVEVRL